jgi:hypothetical protein
LAFIAPPRFISEPGGIKEFNFTKSPFSQRKAATRWFEGATLSSYSSGIAETFGLDAELA